jgi:crotonobetainyl-CoA:carnitine CoA-transferase CaiB-like acyl-CoA transferase
MEQLPLSGIRIMDFGQMWAGAHLTEWLGVMGAEVIKIETTLNPDHSRTTGQPPRLAGKGLEAGSGFASLNYSKKSILLNMKTPKARELAIKLAQISDVVAENFGGAVLNRWGLSYEELKKIKPGIIVYAGSGYGRSGLYMERPSYAEIIEAFDGSTFANGYPGGGPNTVGISSWTDATQAQHGVVAILAALLHRFKTGEGQYIDASMLESSPNLLGELVMGYVMNGSLGERVGNRDSIMAPHGCYPCQGEEEWVAIAVAGQKEWEAFCSVLGNPEWARQEEFSDELSRWKHQDELDQHVEKWTREHHMYEAAEILQKTGIMAAASLSTKQMMEDQHMKERDFFVEFDHPVLGKIPIARMPWRLSGCSKGNYTYPPLFGEHIDYVFGQLLGLSQEEIESYKKEKVIS